MDRMVTEEREALRFEGFTLDLRRGALFDAAGAEVPLRPKTFALLTHFLREPGRLQEREAILDAVWPDVTVGDDSLTQAVAELRRALGNAGPRLLRTIPRRGYLFEAAVEGAPEAESEPPPPPPAVSAATQALAPLPAAAARRQGWWLPALSALGGAAVAALAALLLLQPEPQLPAPSVAAPPAMVMAAAGPGGAAASASPAAPDAAAPAVAAEPPETPRQQARRLNEQAQAVFYARGNAAENWMAARRMYEQAIAADPSYVLPYAGAVFARTNMVLNGRSMNPTRDLQEAEDLAQRAVALEPENPQVHVARAAVARLQRRFQEAHDAYLVAVTRDGTQHAARANLGYTLVLLGRPEEAFEPVRTTLSLQGPAHAFAGTWYTYLGLAAMHAGRPGFGVEEFRLSLQQPRAFLAPEVRHLYTAAALALSGQQAEARSIVEEISRRAPELTQAWFRARPLSDDPEFLRRNEATFLRGLALAGLPE